jgi:hypothetical protein
MMSNKIKINFRLGIIFLIFFGFLSCNTVSKSDDSRMINWEMKVVSGSNKAVIDKTHPGANGNIDGFENGSIIKLSDGSYHLLITEMYKDGKGPAGSWEPARIGHWESRDQGDTWVRLGTIVGGTNVSDDPKRNSWSPMWYLDTVANRWNITWRGNGAVFRYASDQTGDEGINGNYSEVSQIIPPYLCTKIWWYTKYPDSFSKIFKAANGQYYAFVGNAFIGNGKVSKPGGDWNWYVGLATAKSIDGPWYRDSSKTDPDFEFAENPIVLKDRGTYFAVFDDLHYTRSIGYAYSADGVHWHRKNLDLTNYVKWSANHQQVSKDNPMGLVKSLRTPCSLIKEGNDYVILFTAYNDSTSYFEVGKIVVSLDPVN